MVWSNWKGAICFAGLTCASLTCVGLVFSQQSPSRPSDGTLDQSKIVTLAEAGKEPQRVLILKEYRTADGRNAKDVKNLATGEVTTLYMGTPPAEVPSSKTPFPVLKSKQSTQTSQTVEPAKAASDPGDWPRVQQSSPVATAAPQFRTIQEAGKAAVKCQVMVEWKTPEGMKACQLKAVESGEIITVVQTGPVDSTSSGSKAMATRIYHWGRSTTPPPGVPMPSAIQGAEATPPAFGRPANDTTLPLAPVPANSTALAPLPPSPSCIPKMPAELAAAGTSTALNADKVATKSMPCSQFAQAPQSDPLANPQGYATRGTQEMAPALKEIRTMDGSRAPLGAGSVVASGSSPQFMPVPMVTVPQSNPPVPPRAQLPKPPTEAPNPTWYVNAFAPPLPPNAVPDTAFAQQRMSNVPMLPPGYPGANPAMMGYQGVVYMPVPMPINGPGRGNVPMAYQGPMPPVVAGSQAPSMPMMPQGYGMMPVPSYGVNMMEQAYNPQVPQVSMQQSLSTLQTSIYPSQREIAVQLLSRVDVRTNPQVVQVLLTTAKQDPAPTVRAACVSGLVRMGVQNESMIRTCAALKNDSDPRVRLEADRALESVAAQHGGQMVQPARAINP